MTFLLAALLSTQTWQWSEVAGATNYRLAWSTVPTSWCASNSYIFSNTYCSGGVCSGDMPLPAQSVFVIVTALNANGEGPTDHGSVVICP